MCASRCGNLLICVQLRTINVCFPTRSEGVRIDRFSINMSHYFRLVVSNFRPPHIKAIFLTRNMEDNMETTRKKYKPICDISKNQKTGRQYIKNNTYLSVRGYNMTEDKNIPLKSSSNLIQEKVSIFSHLSYLLSSDLIQENTSHTSSSNTGQGNFLPSSSSPSSHLSSSDLIGGSIKNEDDITLSNLSQTNKGYILSNNLLQKKKYNSLSIYLNEKDTL